MNWSLRRFVGVGLVAALLIGCASKYGEQRTSVNYYPACYKPIAELRAGSGAQVAKSAGGGALIGALLGAALGAISGHGSIEGILTGAAVGGVTGTVAGASNGSAQAEENKRLAEYLDQIDGDISNLDLSTASARISLQCYDRQFNSLLQATRNMTMATSEIVSRFQEIESGRQEAIDILSNAAFKADKEKPWGEGGLRKMEDDARAVTRQQEQELGALVPDALRK